MSEQTTAERPKNNIVRTLEPFRVTVVYLYCDKLTYSRNYTKLFGCKPPHDKSCPNGRTSFGPSTQGTYAAIVWLNKRRNRLDALPTFVHELSHLADNVIDLCAIRDSSGETKAYLMESEMHAVASKMFGLGLSEHEYDKIIEKLVDASDKKGDTHVIQRIRENDPKDCRKTLGEQV